MNTLLKAIAIFTLAISAAAQQSTECSPEILPTFCPTVHNPCCKFLCSGGGEPACWDRNITGTETSPSGSRHVTCELCPTGLAYIPKVVSTSSEEPPAAATTAEQPAEVTTEGAPLYATDVPVDNGTATTLEPVPTGNDTGNGTETPGIPEPTYISGASSVLSMSGAAIVGVFCFMMVL
ncbi:uncharacterized protein DFL_001663 [Arthrobotrys flagrans]|uniref:Uncharacterized protein n=1 Tax=Arthrobotrys flagrans TaxID=97331 RepID=A0A437A8E2_ARTFL|nr:hypothetical protein DFL_001663 [Arthrobotrys flagrans]